MVCVGVCVQVHVYGGEYVNRVETRGQLQVSFYFHFVCFKTGSLTGLELMELLD